MTIVAEAGNLPVVDADAQQVEGLLAEVFTAWAQAGEEDLLVPYLDYATETFYDTITAAVQDLLAGQRSPAGVPRPPRVRVHGRRRELSAVRRNGASMPVAQRRVPGEPRLLGYLYILPAVVVFVAFIGVPLGRSVSLSLYEWDGLGDKVWAGTANYREVFTDPELRSAFAHAARARSCSTPSSRSCSA